MPGSGGTAPRSVPAVERDEVPPAAGSWRSRWPRDGCQAEELALDPIVAPPRVLPGQAQDQVPGLRIDRRSAGPPVWSGPLACHKLPVPSKERLRPDQERAPHPSGQEPARRGKERPVRPAVHGWLHLTAQDGQLVPKDDDLQIGLSHRALARAEQAEEATQQKVEERPNHGGGLSQMTVQAPSCDLIEFLDPTSPGRAHTCR